MTILRTGAIGACMIASLQCIPNLIHPHSAELVERPPSSAELTGKQA